jgi:hypothetical protein
VHNIFTFIGYGSCSVITIYGDEDDDCGGKDWCQSCIKMLEALFTLEILW